jgi:hypothetical protein
MLANLPLVRHLAAPGQRLRLLLARLPAGVRWVLVLALVLRGVGLGWGMPASDAWDNDGVAPRDILPGLAATFTPGDYYTYPPLQLALLTLLTLPVTLIAVTRAGSVSVPTVIQEIIKPPYMTAITMTARVVTLLMSLGIVITLALLAGDLSPRKRRSQVMTFAALFASLNWSFTYYAHTSNLDVPYLFWACLAVLTLERSLRLRRPKLLRTFAIFAAMAVATKDQAYAMFILGAPLSIALWLAFDRTARSLPSLKQIAKELGLAVLLGLGLLLVLDGAFMNPSGFRARVRFLTGSASKDFEMLSRDAHGRLLAFAESFLYFRRHYPPIVATLVVAGIGATLARARTLGHRAVALALLPACIAVSFSVAFNVAALRTEERFTLPQMLMGAVYAGAGIDALVSFKPPALRVAGRAVVSVLLGIALVECLRVDATLLSEPRYETEAFLQANAAATDTIETHGLNVYLPRFSRAWNVMRVGPTDPARRGILPGVQEVQAPLMDIEARRPRFIVVSDCYVWRYLERSDLDRTSGYIVPPTQRGAAGDADATTFFRALFRGELRYRLANEARVRGFERAWIHGSLGCAMYTFERTTNDGDAKTPARL